MTRHVRVAPLTIAALAFVGVIGAGCSSPLTNGPIQAASVEQRYPVTVEPQMASLSVRIDEGLQRLDPSESARIAAFAERWKMRGQGMITVSAPQGSPNQRAGEMALSQTVSILTKAGIPSAAISRTGYPAAQNPGEPPVTLSFMSMAAVGPDCTTLGWTDNIAFSTRNTPWNNFGCASQSNFAAMVSNPHDLVAPQPMGDVDMARRAKVIELYRNGKASQTKREKDESGKVTDTKFGDGAAN